jgi:glycosyltransferase involved in cell wall biosynthesis
MISVIVPVYNVEQGIGRCIDSVMNQSYSDWELILVDDGSSDRSGALCDEYAARDTRIRVVHKENGGVSMARNLGLDMAQGEWVVFVDGDDTISPNHLKLIKEHAEHDIIVFGMVIENYTESGKLHYSECILISEEYVKPINKLYEDYTLILRSLNLESSACKGYRRDIIELNGIRYNNDSICFEDFDFVLRYLSCCKGTFCSVPYIAYHYWRELAYNPIKRRKNRDLQPSVFAMLQSLIVWIDPKILSEENRKTFFYCVADKYRLLLNQLKDVNYREAKSKYRNLLETEWYRAYGIEINAHGGRILRIVMTLNRNGLTFLAHQLNKLRR